MTTDLDSILKNTPHICKGGHLFPNTVQGISTGFAQLDAILAGKGWPLGAVTELLPEVMGIGELRLLLPAIREATQQQQRVLMINAPYQPYAPALAQAGIDLDYVFLISPRSRADALWGAEKALHGGVCKILLLWPDYLGSYPVGNAAVRRLQVAAQIGGSMAVLYRSSSPTRNGSTNQSNWAALRLRLSGIHNKLRVELLKAVGTYARASIILDEEAKDSCFDMQASTD